MMPNREEVEILMVEDYQLPESSTNGQRPTRTL
jgi:hypothetical protein